MQKNQFAKDIQPGQEVESLFLLEELRLGQTKGGKPFASLRLKDRTGALEAKIWDNAEELAERVASAEVLAVMGRAESFQGRVQLKVLAAQAVDPAAVDMALFIPASPHDPEEMYAELLGLVKTMKNPHLAGLLHDILTDPQIGPAFRLAPAAKRFHHAFSAGLLDHTLGVARCAAAVAGFYPVLDRDLLLAGAMLHDLGKVREFSQGARADYTTEGRLVGHMVLGLKMMNEKIAARPDFPAQTALLLEHMLLAHHGEYEFGSPRRPKTLEALALHHLDELDAKVRGIADFIDRHASEETGWTDYNRLMERFFFRPGQAAQAPGPARKRQRAKKGRGAGETPEEEPDQLSLL